MERIINIVPDSTWQLTFKKLPPVMFWCGIREYPWLSEKAIRRRSCFSTLYMCSEAEFSSSTQPKQQIPKIEYKSRYENLLSSSKADVRVICRKNTTFSMWYINTMEYYSAVRKDEILAFATAWMDPENIMLSEINHMGKVSNHTISLICWI